MQLHVLSWRNMYHTIQLSLAVIRVIAEIEFYTDDKILYSKYL